MEFRTNTMTRLLWTWARYIEDRLKISKKRTTAGSPDPAGRPRAGGATDAAVRQVRERTGADLILDGGAGSEGGRGGDAGRNGDRRRERPLGPESRRRSRDNRAWLSARRPPARNRQ